MATFNISKIIIPNGDVLNLKAASGTPQSVTIDFYSGVRLYNNGTWSDCYKVGNILIIALMIEVTSSQNSWSAFGYIDGVSKFNTDPTIFTIQKKKGAQVV